MDAYIVLGQYISLDLLRLVGSYMYKDMDGAVMSGDGIAIRGFLHRNAGKTATAMGKVVDNTQLLVLLCKHEYPLNFESAIKLIKLGRVDAIEANIAAHCHTRKYKNRYNYLTALVTGNLETVRSLYKSCSRLIYGNILHTAFTNSPRVLDFLLKNGAECSHSTVTGYINNDNLDMVQVCYENGCDMACVTQYAYSRPQILDFFISAGICCTNLAYRACGMGNLAVVKRLCYAGCVASDAYICIWNRALFGGHIDIIKYLHSIGQDGYDDVVFMGMVINGEYTDTVNAMLDIYGLDALHFDMIAAKAAISDGNLHLVRELYNLGVNCGLALAAAKAYRSNAIVDFLGRRSSQ